MHIFLYEWITGGGLVEQSGPLPPSLRVEGAAMVAALATDFSAIDNCRVTLLRDIRIDDLPLPGCEIVEIHSAEDRRDEIERLSAEADHTLVIAPEFDNLLLAANRLVRFSGGRLLAGSEEFVSLAGDKHRTAECLTATGVLVPDAVLLGGDEERLPLEFAYPAVLKPVQGAGSQHTLLVSGSQDEPPPYPWPRRLERFCPGMAVSVAFLCGPAGVVALPACRQHLSGDGRFFYTGGSLLREPELVRRATQLALRAVESLAPERGAVRGYVGVDLVLGKRADAAEDVVIEVNPRMTTSYVGLREACEGNLAAAMIAVAEGETVDVRFCDTPLEFSADGAVMRHLPKEGGRLGSRR